MRRRRFSPASAGPPWLSPTSSRQKQTTGAADPTRASSHPVATLAWMPVVHIRSHRQAASGRIRRWRSVGIKGDGRKVGAAGKWLDLRQEKVQRAPMRWESIHDGRGLAGRRRALSSSQGGAGAKRLRRPWDPCRDLRDDRGDPGGGVVVACRTITAWILWSPRRPAASATP